MRSARVANHFLRAPVALNRPHCRQFASACAANWFLSTIVRERYTRRTTTWGGRGGGVVFFFILFQFSDKIFVINGLDEKHVRLNERLFRSEKSCRFWRCSKIRHETRSLSSIAAFNYITRSCRVTSQTTISIRALFATLKFQLGSINELTAAERRTYDLHRGLVILFPHRGDLKIIASPCLSISYSLIPSSLKARCRH